MVCILQWVARSVLMTGKNHQMELNEKTHKRWGRSHIFLRNLCSYDIYGFNIQIHTSSEVQLNKSFALFPAQTYLLCKSNFLPLTKKAEILILYFLGFHNGSYWWLLMNHCYSKRHRDIPIIGAFSVDTDWAIIAALCKSHRSFRCLRRSPPVRCLTDPKFNPKTQVPESWGAVWATRTSPVACGLKPAEGWSQPHGVSLKLQAETLRLSRFMLFMAQTGNNTVFTSLLEPKIFAPNRYCVFHCLLIDLIERVVFIFNLI